MTLFIDTSAFISVLDAGDEKSPEGKEEMGGADF